MNLHSKVIFCTCKEQSRKWIKAKRQEVIKVEDMNVKELAIQEVNIYEESCGEIQFHCLNDCYGGGAWLSIEN